MKMKNSMQSLRLTSRFLPTPEGGGFLGEFGEAASILGENKKSAHSEFIRQAHTFGVTLGNTYGSLTSNQPKKSKKTRIKNNMLMLDEELTKNIEIMAELSGMKKEEFVLKVLKDITKEHKDIIGAYKLARARIGA